MKPGLVFSIVLTVVGLSAMVFAFLSNASPYVTVAQAKESGGNNLHLAGELDTKTIRSNPTKNEVRFIITDEQGQSMNVVYHGQRPANMGDANKIVAVGGMKDGEFHASKLLIKCPSKYESTKS